MQTTRVITPEIQRPELATYSGAGDSNRYKVAAPHWALSYRRITAASAYAGTVLEIGVPVNQVDRLVFADIASAAGVTDVGTCLGEVEFLLSGAPALKLPFDFLPGNVVGNQEIGFHVTSSSAANTPINTLGVDIGTGTRVFIPAWSVRIACHKIVIRLRAGTASATDNCFVILGCLSQGSEE